MAVKQGGRVDNEVVMWAEGVVGVSDGVRKVFLAARGWLVSWNTVVLAVPKPA